MNILAFFCLAINSSLACLFVVFTGTWRENPDYATLLMIGNTVAINLFALVLCGFAAHITSITDSTIRSVQNQFSFGVAKCILSRERRRAAGAGAAGAGPAVAPGDGAEQADPVREGVDRATMLQEIQVLNDLLAYAKESGGFRLLGQRISYSFFLIAFTALLGVANIFVSRIKQQK